MEIQEKIRLMRNAKNWSQEEMANKLGMSVNGYANIEHGTTDLHVKKIKKIAKIFEIDLMELLNFGEKGFVCLIGIGDNNSCNDNKVFNNSNPQHEIEKLQLEVKYLKEMLELMKGKSNHE